MNCNNNWWKERVVYQIYPRSFQDTSGNGIGDIPGIIKRLDEIRALGVGIIWLCPVYKSPDADNGYDISDYRDINPKFGTMADMEMLFAEAEKRDIKVIMDLVINHTSDEHDWFQKSRNKDNPERDYYIWKPPNEEGNEPNNWTSFFMGSAWKFDAKSGEYYLHLFHEKQPDLNFRNPKVIEEVKEIMHFWLKKGAAGFRCDVINVIFKSSFDDGVHRMAMCGREHYVTQDEAHSILQELRRDVLDKYDCFTVGEITLASLRDAKLLTNPERKELDMVFCLDHLNIDRRIENLIPKRLNAKKLLKVLTRWQQGLDWSAVCLENHDQPRIVSHFGDDVNFWERSAKLLAILQFTQRGTPFIYQGQEIGMTNFDFNRMSQIDDVASIGIDKLLRSYHIPSSLRWKWLRESSRDNARTPMQWSAEPNAGFTTGRPWLGINSNYVKVNYEEQKNREDSILNFYKQMIAFRASSETLKYGEFTPIFGSKQILAYARSQSKEEQLAVVLNMSGKPASMPVDHSLVGRVIVSNTNKTDFDGTLAPWEGVILKTR